MTPSRPEREHAFRACYSAHFADLLAYAVRRVEQPADAGDVVAETFLVAWRRFGDLPEGDQARLWLFGVARNVLANHHRGDRRRRRLGERLRERLEADLGEDRTPVADDHADAVARRAVVHAALRSLGEADREVLALSAWEQLEPREIATVLDVSAAAVRTRLSRARSRLRDALAGQLDEDGPAAAGDGAGDDAGDDGAPGGHVGDDARSLTEEYR